MPDLDLRAIATGTGLAIGIAVPLALLAQILDDADKVDDDSPWLLVLFLGVLAAMALGGFVAASRRPDAPLSHAAVAALAAYLLVQGIGAARLTAAGDEVTWTAVPFFALLSTASGVAGGLGADRVARRGPRR